MGQRRVDREWPVPKQTRHVWVKRPGPHTAPVQGFVLDWRRHSYRWSALVVTVYVTDGHLSVLQEWLPAEMLTAVKSDPNLRPPWGLHGQTE